jgi:hypothetical protein
MSENVIQTSFSAGELSPNLLARVDFAKYRSGAATMRNFFVDYRSGASTRPGTEFIRPCPGGQNIRLVRFQQSVSVTYVLEFGHGYIRFISNGASIVEPAFAITNIDSVSVPGQTLVYATGYNYTNGNLIFISGVNGMPQINNRYFYVTSTSADGWFAISDSLTGQVINSSGWGPYAGGGIVQRVYTVSAPFTSSQLALLKFSQNAAVMNITHPNHPPHKLTLISAANWVLQPAVFGSTAPATVIANITVSNPGPASYKYAVTSVDENNQESTPSFPAIAQSADLRTTAGSIILGWNSIIQLGKGSYNVYGTSPSYVGWNYDTSGLGYIGSTDASVASLVDSNIAPDFSVTPPIHQNPFTQLNPQVSSYFQQRLVYANGGGAETPTFWMSKVGAPYNFDISNPIQANDAITGTLVSLEVNEIKSLVPMPTGLVALTTHGAWLISGGAGGVATQGAPITPQTATATPQSYVGANDVPPIVVNYDIVFIQQKGSIIRDMTYNIYANIYTGNDISILSSHLFYGHQILEWAYAEEPFKIIWCVREDGALLSLTLVKEQDMYGWARHDTFGNFKSVCTVTEGSTDATYFVVERPSPAGSGFVRQIERLADRVFPFGSEDSWSVDAGVSTIHNFPNATLNTQTQYIPGVVPLVAAGELNLFVNPGVFSPGMVGWIVRAGGGIMKIISVINSWNATAQIIQPITDLLPNDPLKRPEEQPPGRWTLDPPFTNIYGLDHLEGKPVSVLADGGVINGLIVHQGSITLPQPATNVIVGYGFQAQLQTMPLDLGNEINTVQGKRKKVAALTVRCKDSRGVKAGRTFGTVTPIKELNRTTLMGLPIPLVTADERIVMDPLWDVPGQICIQIDDPLPATILGVIPEVAVGDTSK